MAPAAEERKEDKYRYLPSTHWFSPLSIETMGAMGPKSMALLREVGHRVAVCIYFLMCSHKSIHVMGFWISYGLKVLGCEKTTLSMDE